MNVESHLDEAVDHILDLLLSCPFLHDHDHYLVPLLFLSLKPLDPAALVNNALEQTLKALIVQRSIIGILDSPQNLAFPLRIVDSHIEIMFDSSDFNCAFRAFIQQLHELSVDFIDFAPPIFNTHDD